MRPFFQGNSTPAPITILMAVCSFLAAIKTVTRTAILFHGMAFRENDRRKTSLAGGMVFNNNGGY